MGLIVSIFRPSGSQITTTWDHPDLVYRPGVVEALTIVNIDGPFEPSDERPAALLVEGAYPGICVVVPAVELPTPDGASQYVERQDPGAVRMAGGSYVATSDSRFNEAVRKLVNHPFYGAVPLHDMLTRSF